MSNTKRIPYIPKQSHDFKRMQYFHCKTDTNVETVTRAVFLRLLEQQPCPTAQLYVDLDGGCAYLFPYCETRAEGFINYNRETESAHRQFRRDQQAIRTGKRQTALSLDFELDEEGTRILDTLASDDTPESFYLTREENDSRRAAFAALTEADQELLLGYLSARGNARELARRLGKDPSGVSKRLNRAMDRLKKNIEKNS